MLGHLLCQCWQQQGFRLPTEQGQVAEHLGKKDTAGCMCEPTFKDVSIEGETLAAAALHRSANS